MTNTNKNLIQQHDELAEVVENVVAETNGLTQQLAHLKEKISGTIYVDAFAHLKDGDDWSPAIQYIFDTLETGEVVLPNESIEIHDQCICVNSNVKLRGQPNTQIINMTNASQGAPKAIFLFAGRVAETASILSNAVTKGQKTIIINNTANLKEGDILGFRGVFSTRNLSVVVSVNTSTNTIVLDREFYENMNVGTAVLKLEPIENVEITDLDFDFNNQYSYGVSMLYARNSTIRRVKGKTIGSKVVRVGNSLDCLFEDITGETAFDTVGGQGYILRLAVCNDCKVVRAIGKNVRHVVDLSGACRNTVIDCEGYGNISADYVTHGNYAKDNQFINCKSNGNNLSAYSINPYPNNNLDGGGEDTGNMVIDGSVVGGRIFYHPIDTSTVIRGLTIKNTQIYGGLRGGDATFEDCTIICDNVFLYVPEDNAKITFKNCRFVVNVSNGLASMTNFMNVLTLVFDNCHFEINFVGTVASFGVNTTTVFKNCTLTIADNTANNPPIQTKGAIEATGCKLAFKNQGVSIFGLQETTSKLVIKDCDIINASESFRPVVNSGAELTIGNNRYINSNLQYLGRYKSIKTINAVDLGFTTKPIDNHYVNGAIILNSTPTPGKAQSWVKTSNGWFANGWIGTVFTTATRPSSPELGFTGLDTTLGKQITWTGTAWKDATGTTV